MWTGLYQSLCSRFISLCSLIVSIFRKTPTSARKPFSAVSISLSTSILSLSLSLLLTRYCSHTFSLISCTLRLSLFVAFSFHLPQILPTYKTSSLSLSPFSLSRQTRLERHSLNQGLIKSHHNTFVVVRKRTFGSKMSTSIAKTCGMDETGLNGLYTNWTGDKENFTFDGKL